MSKVFDHKPPQDGCFTKARPNGELHNCWLPRNHEGKHRCFLCDYEWDSETEEKKP